MSKVQIRFSTSTKREKLIAAHKTIGQQILRVFSHGPTEERQVLAQRARRRIYFEATAYGIR